MSRAQELRTVRDGLEPLAPVYIPELWRLNKGLPIWELTHLVSQPYPVHSRYSVNVSSLLSLQVLLQVLKWSYRLFSNCNWCLWLGVYSMHHLRSFSNSWFWNRRFCFWEWELKFCMSYKLLSEVHAHGLWVAANSKTANLPSEHASAHCFVVS